MGLSLGDASSSPRLSLCAAHGPGAAPDSFPLQDIQCTGTSGRAGQQSVALNGCVANITAHGYVHADHPNVTYLGMMTVDIRFQKDAGPDDGIVQFTVHTPKAKIKLIGSVTGTVTMSTCP